MGDLKGHALPGSLFLFFGFWWAFQGLRRYFMSRKDGLQYRATAAFNVTCVCCKNPRYKNWPVEGFFKIALSSFGLLLELFAHLPVPPMPIVQHATMYFFFLVSGVVDVSLHYNIPLPPGSDYMSLALAFTVEGLLFANHLHGRPILDVHLHVLLVYVIVVTVAVLVLECRFRESPLLTLCRGYLVMLQGSWFWAVGIILYGHGGEHLNTAWEMDKPEEVMISTIYFTWHCAALFILLFLLAVFMSCCYVGFRRSRATSSKPLRDGALKDTEFQKLQKLLDEFSDDADDGIGEDDM
ncbi:transmembrane protein 45B [Aplysia californica]|uniref:Transmembrane protein 45B n=1 Tax=Aplysia californica TaxID=6500 RepID=A0ABM1AAP5_APLCA|nr:transmembrane protein 45B [Aplysia californica]